MAIINHSHDLQNGSHALEVTSNYFCGPFFSHLRRAWIALICFATKAIHLGLGYLAVHRLPAACVLVPTEGGVFGSTAAAIEVTHS